MAPALAVFLLVVTLIRDKRVLSKFIIVETKVFVRLGRGILLKRLACSV